MLTDQLYSSETETDSSAASDFSSIFSRALRIAIHTPLMHWNKARIIQEGLALGVDYGLTHSCYDPTPEGLACGHCDSCLLRKKGFEEAGVADPTRYVAAHP